MAQDRENVGNLNNEREKLGGDQIIWGEDQTMAQDREKVGNLNNDREKLEEDQIKQWHRAVRKRAT